jgi:hypothetical protein
MKILYYSVHQILEFDEISLLQSLGHEVFPLGTYFGGTSSEPFRPIPQFPHDLSEDLAVFQATGGRYRYGAPAAEQAISRAFVERFDAVVVMHDLDFIELYWEALSATTVIWRAIGVGTQLFEPRVAALRSKGLKIVRYCPTEARADGYAGHDAVIRFGKIDHSNSWIGGRPELLTFSHAYRQRFPVEFDFYMEATKGLSALLGGAGNEDVPGALGIVDFDTQNDLFAHCAAYFYASGSFIPYTLNFMEAWLSGIPLVAINCRTVYPEEQCRFSEVPDLIRHGVNGFLVSTPEEASATFKAIIEQPELAKAISAKGVEAARSYFSSEVIGPKWQALLNNIA